MVHHLLKVLYTTGGVCRHSGGTSSVLLAPVPCSTCISNALPSLHTDGLSTGWLVATIWVVNCRSGICRCSDVFSPIRSWDHNIGHVIVIWVQQASHDQQQCIQNKIKMATRELKFFWQFSPWKYGILPQILLELSTNNAGLCQIEDCASITAGRKAS